MSEPAPKIKRALLSVFDKEGLVEFASGLAEHDIELVSTGGTARALEDAGLAVRDISDVTGFPEIMDGRVKTLHPKVHGGLLSVRDDAGHQADQAAQMIEDIDLVVVNLYPFEHTLASGADEATIIENIDIGGPAMIRAAAKNHRFVTIITDRADYADILKELADNKGATSLATRKQLAARAYARTAAYDAAIGNWFAHIIGDAMPDYRSFGGKRAQTLRYGENPHQAAGFYVSGDQRPGVATATQLQGKALSYNNINDTDAAFECVAEFDPAQHAAVAIVKHANPCGVALTDDLTTAYQRALRCDPLSAFGGIVALNRAIDAKTAAAIIETFTEVIIAPDADDAAREIIAGKKNLRLLITGGLPDPASPGLAVKSVAGGFLVQSRDNGVITRDDLKFVTKRKPDDAQLADMLFAFKICKHVKSNAIIYAKNRATVGIGAGQMSRIDASVIAAQKALEATRAAGLDKPLTEGCVVASEAFFPFADGLLKAAEAGAEAIIQPGGSIRDDEVIEAADKAGLAMVFTGMRHFRH